MREPRRVGSRVGCGEMLPPAWRYTRDGNPTGKNTRLHQELQRRKLRRKISQHTSGVNQRFTYKLYTCYVSYGLVCSLAPMKIFGALTASKFQRNGFAETFSTTDGFFQSGDCMHSNLRNFGGSF